MNGKDKATASSRAFSFTATALVFALIATVACFNAAPSECIEAAEAAGLPEEALEQLRNPGDLNAIERAALNRMLSQAGIDDICEVASEAADSAEVPNSAPSDRPSPGENDERAESEQARDDGEPVQQTIAAQRSARIPEDDEHRRRCRFWALNNLEPVVYAEFTKMDPDSMDDLDRILWRTKLHRDSSLGYYDDDYAERGNTRFHVPGEPGIYCRDYWAEPLSRSNADLRNHGFERSCRLNLEERITQQYRHIADAVNYREDEDKELAFQIPNQYVRILRWMDISGGDLLDSGNPPYRILEEQSRHGYAYYDAYSIPTEEALDDYRNEMDTQLNLEWLGILTAADLEGDSSDIRYCHYYYPQVFFGYWVPFDPDQMRNRNQEQEIDLLEYGTSATPLYLPKTVTAERVKPGYPLGLDSERYHLCRASSETEEVGYHYVDHPAGDYCEKIP